MPHWLIKAALQRGISMLPASHKWNELFQKHVTKSIELTPARFDERLSFCRRHFDNFVELRATAARAFTVVELGTGWYPTVPVGLFLCGASEIWTYDINPLLSVERLRRLFSEFLDYSKDGRLQKTLPGILPERVERLATLAKEIDRDTPAAVLEKMNVHARVQDAQHTGLNPTSVDLFVSTGVLEYIPPMVLSNILAEFQRISRPGAVMSHYLNLVDQYSYFDRSITPFNFLKFPARRWKFLNSPLTWQNRLRISDYRDLFARTGFDVVKEESTSGSTTDLRRISLAPEFLNYKEADLLVMISWIAAKSRN